ncbi:BLUF domain-containing protein [Marivita sp. S6314]|uniref:BLUF domain-containing protein n=1 Tax=Marivita sp. S6314 TaxID=2926406 RepID=UPI001FF6C6BF|nr:BLUF domain-containing protein [Marivita sp. S6314]MCK0150569.1 BLUF domain-containing protein [Marivita sp. S6314]
MAFTGAAIISDLIQIIYSSRPFGYDDAMLNGVLMDARRCNMRDGVSGALICRQDVYLQLLEGPAQAVEATCDRIRRDDRHLEMAIRVNQQVAARMFGDWAMFHDPAKSWLWSAQDISDGALERASGAHFKQVFERLAADAKTG